MRALVQRVSHAEVRVAGERLSQCGVGLMILVCAMQGDSDDKPALLAGKIAKLRIFKDDAGKMNRSLIDTGGSALVISQFTLAADTTRGNRPGFSAAADPATGERLYTAFAQALRDLGIVTETGQFGADMAVSLTNDGPVTISVEV